MTATQKTVGFLRTLTADGFLSTEEIWSLAKFFNENGSCQNVWPGNLLVPMLGSAFEDAELTEEEMEILASTITSIEQEWGAKNPQQEQARKVAETALEVRQASMPCLDLSFEMPAGKEDLVYVVKLLQHTCTCPDWRQRQIWPVAHPGRCCKHVAHAFAQTGKPMEPWLQALLDDCFLRGRGTDPVDDWLLLRVPKTKPALISGGPGEWCSVFAPEAKGYERYAFNRLDGRWSYGTAPAISGYVERTIREHF